MSKLLLVVPDYSDKEIDNFSKKALTLPYGAVSLASYVEEYCYGTQCEILDLNTFSTREEQYEVLRQKIIDFTPDFVGLSVMFNSGFEQVPLFCETVKGVNSKIVIFAGGVLATNLPKDLFDATDLLDAICYGEGEIPLKDLLLSKDIQEVFEKHKSWITKEGLEKGKKVNPTFVQNLDDIPFLKYEKVEVDKYIGRTSADNIVKKSLPIHSSRGCPYSCVFCCAGTNHGKKLRCMSAERFLSDVKVMIEKYGIEKISIDDDQFLFYRDRAVAILKGLAEFNIEIELASGMSVKFIDDEIAELLKKAGLKIAFIAVESGSPRVLKDIINKPLDVSQVKPVVESLKKAGLLVHSPFLIGFPGETQEDRDMSRQLMLDVGFDWNFIFIVTPYKGSKLYDICVENHYIDEADLANLNVYNCVIKAPGINPEEITKQAYLLNLDVNFVNNYNYANGNYSVALDYFAKLAEKYPTHAFAHYYSSLCYEKLNNSEKAKVHRCEFEKIIDSDEKWKQHAIYFGIIK